MAKNPSTMVITTSQRSMYAARSSRSWRRSSSKPLCMSTTAAAGIAGSTGRLICTDLPSSSSVGSGLATADLVTAAVLSMAGAGLCANVVAGRATAIAPATRTARPPSMIDRNIPVSRFVDISYATVRLLKPATIRISRSQRNHESSFRFSTCADKLGASVLIKPASRCTSAALTSIFRPTTARISPVLFM